MIVKVPKARQDGGSSFDDLEAYLTEGIGQAGIDNDVGGFDRLTQYITKDSVLDALGKYAEKTIAVEIGNVSCLKHAAAEMRAAASKNARVHNPVYHYILSWPEGEWPDPKAIFAAARNTLQALGVAQHQYLVAIHGNTDNIHAHVVVNRVHPITYKAARLEWAHKTLHKAIRQIEIDHGWRHENGIYKVIEFDGKKRVVLNTDYLDPDRVPARGAAASYEAWHGEQSLETWCRATPAAALKILLAGTNATSWQDIHRTLARFGLQLRDSGGGGMRVHAAAPGQRGKDITVSASKAFRFLKRKELERRFGLFEAMGADVTVLPERTYKRDPVKRLDRRLERQALREVLHARFVADQHVRRQEAAIAKQILTEQFSPNDRLRREALAARYRQQRLAIKAGTSLSPKQKQQAYMLAKLSMLQAKEQLREQLLVERKARRALIPTLPTWREWVEEQALVYADEAAISALRGLVYQEKRNGKKAADIALEEQSTVAVIRPAEPSYTDPYVRKIALLHWKVFRNGDVLYYFKSGAAAFTDAGEKLLFNRGEVSDEALALTLQYAYDKWGGGVRVTGGDAHFRVRVARLAAELGIAVNNPELQTVHREVRERLAMKARGFIQTNRMPRDPSGKTGEASQTSTAAASLEKQLLRRFPQAEIFYAATQHHDYRGRIVGADGEHIVQQVGNGRLVLHERANIDGELPPRDIPVTFSYRSGRATLTTRTARGRE